MYIPRILQLNEILKQKSFFLLGPRATGKTRLIEEQLSDKAFVIDLLNTDLYLKLLAEPGLIYDLILTNDKKIVVIDEVQKIPILLNEVHRLIEKHNIKFLLTGSSARSLKENNVNLLAGRAWEAHLFPLTSKEIPSFDLNKYLLFGGMPVVVTSTNPKEELIAYINTYLKEEIQAEAMVRKIHSFAKFLQIAALSSGKMLNFSSIANDVGLTASTIREYYRILEDTLLGFILPAWTYSKKRKAISTAKFYLFDLGIKNRLMDVNHLEPHSDLYGQAFEHFIALELKAYISYKRKHLELRYWQTKHGHEVDFIIGNDVAIEVKSSKKTSSKHRKNLKLLQEENICKSFFLVSFDQLSINKEGISQLHWQDFLTKLWNEEII